MKKDPKTNTEQYTRLNSRADLDRLAEANRDLVALRHEQAERDPNRKVQVELLVCGGTGCHSMEAGVVIENLRKALVDHNVDWAKVVQVGCLGFCAQGPIVLVMPDNIFYVKVQPEDAERIVTEHVIKNEIINDLIYVDPETGEYVPHHADMSFYRKQKRVALRNCGLIDPEEIMESIAVGGYQALAKCLFDYTPQEVIDVLKDSGLRGRGGAGFPTGVKWQFAANNQGEKKYVICNGDEGDPGAFMDRSIMEDDPNSVIEAMTIAGYAIGAHDGLIYVRAEYPVAVWRLQTAIHEARMLGLLGKNILGSGFDFDITISLGAGAFVCGEETALIHSAEGHRGEPTRKPPFPAESGYMGLPTIVNNVETFANVPIIITKGAEWFSSIGTEHSKGTKVFALAGHVNNIGLVEVPMGTTLREIVFEIGGGVPDGKAFKAVQTGGPSGGVITSENLDTPIDFQSLASIGSMMGSGGMIVMNEDNDMVEVARFYLDFTCDESCGKCTPCRIGTTRVRELLDKLLDLRGDMETLVILKQLCKAIRDSALCALGQTAPNPVLSTMQYFPEEYERYARREVRKYYSIDPELCIGCTRCVKACPVDAISGTLRQPHVIDPEKCIACGACHKVCPVKPDKAIVLPR